MERLDIDKLNPGDVIAVRVGGKLPWFLIWLHTFFTKGSSKYADFGHIAVVKGFDEEGRLWGIEAQPKRIGWVLLDNWKGREGISNWEQPKADEQRQNIVVLMEELLKSKYDYSVYILFALQVLGITPNWIREFTGELVPPNMMCAALADFAYEHVGLPNPGGAEKTRFTTPAEWAEFIDSKQWQN